MDQKALVDDFKKLAAELESRYGPVVLMMLLSPDLGIRVWNLVVSAKGLDEFTRGEAIHHIVELVYDLLPAESLKTIIRVTPLKTDDPFVKEMNAFYEAEDKVVRLHGDYISGVEIPEAIVLQSKAA